MTFKMNMASCTCSHALRMCHVTSGIGSMIVCLLLFISSIPQVEAAHPQMANHMLNITFEAGKNAVLTCTVRNIGKRRVVWKRLSDPFPISVGTSMFAPRSKYRVKRDGDDWRLTIKNIRVNDAGEYECRVTGTENVADLLSLIIPGAGETYIMPTDSIVRASIGDEVVLPCHVQKLRKNLVLWQNEDRRVVSLRRKVYLGDKGRIRLQHGTREEWSLRFNGVKENDFGVYTCVVNTDPPLTRSVTLLKASADHGFDKNPETGESVGKSPSLVMETFRDKVNVHEGHTVTLTCKFIGDPQPRIRWSRHIVRNGKDITENLNSEGENYLLTNAKLEDAGTYVCKATNGVPPLASGKIEVKVIEMTTTTTTTTTTTPFDPVGDTKPRAYALEDVVYQRKGRDAELSCKGVGVPRPQVTWIFNGQTLYNDWKHNVVYTEHRHHTVHATLTVRSIGSPNYGKYECYVWNRYGDDKITVTLAEDR